jgi:hypothetical protein
MRMETARVNVGIASRSAILVYDSGDDQDKGQETDSVDIRGKFVGGADGEEDDPLQHEEEEGSAEGEEEPVAGAPPKLKKEKCDRQAGHAKGPGKEGLDHDNVHACDSKISP